MGNLGGMRRQKNRLTAITDQIPSPIKWGGPGRGGQRFGSGVVCSPIPTFPRKRGKGQNGVPASSQQD